VSGAATATRRPAPLLATVVTVFQVIVRASGLVQITLGLLFWSGNALGLIRVHMLVGLLLVLSLWALALIGARLGVSPALVALALAWGLLTPALGLTQDRLLVGSGHWSIQVAHLLVGLAAIAQAENLARRGKARLAERASA